MSLSGHEFLFAKLKFFLKREKGRLIREKLKNYLFLIYIHLILREA